jgi:hypothetical protein
MGELSSCEAGLPRDSLHRAPKDSKDSFARIPAVRVAGDPEGTQRLSRVQQMALVEIPAKSLEAAEREPVWSAKVHLGSAGLLGGSVVAIG